MLTKSIGKRPGMVIVPSDELMGATVAPKPSTRARMSPGGTLASPMTGALPCTVIGVVLLLRTRKSSSCGPPLIVASTALTTPRKRTSDPVGSELGTSALTITLPVVVIVDDASKKKSSPASNVRSVSTPTPVIMTPGLTVRSSPAAADSTAWKSKSPETVTFILIVSGLLA